jgi:hypothetical protein
MFDMTLTLPESKKKITFESFLTWLEQLPDEQKELISDRLRRYEFKKIQADFQKMAQIIPNPDFSEDEIMREIKAFRNGH